MDDELHAAAFVEEALGDDGALGGDCAEDGAAFADIGGGLAAGVGVEEGEVAGQFARRQLSTCVDDTRRGGQDRLLSWEAWSRSRRFELSWGPSLRSG